MDELTQIPNTQGYVASRDGAIIGPDGLPQSLYRNGDGYFTVCVLLNDGRFVTMGLHRVLALTFIPCPGDPKDYVVNHRDLDIENYALSNLEWVTVEQNNIHAELFGEECGVRVNLIASKDNVESYFMSIGDASAAMGVEPLEIWDSIKNQLPVKGVQFTYVKKGKKPKAIHSGNQWSAGVSRPKEFYQKKPIWIKDIDSGDIWKYESVTEAAKAFHVSNNHINFAICRPEKPRLFKSTYLVSDTGKFPEISPAMVEARRASGGRTVVAYNLEEKFLLTFTSASTFIQQFGLSKKAITTALKQDRLIPKQGWVFLYGNDYNVRRLREYIANLGIEVPDLP